MIGVYIRISSHSQKGDSQKATITQWLANHGHPLTAVRWYEDTETGKTLQRAGFQALHAAIFRGEVKMVVVRKLDRLARSLREGVNVLAGWCQRKVWVGSVTQPIDLSGTVGHLIASLLFGMAEMELQHIKGKQGATKARPERARALQTKELTAQEIANILNVSERTGFRYLAP